MSHASLSFPSEKTPSPLDDFESSQVHLETEEKFTRQGTFVNNIVVPTDKCDDPSFFSGLSKSNTPDRIQTALGDEEESVKPVIHLPKQVEFRSDEEDETVIFEERAKLFRFHDGEWKERGLGGLKLLWNNTNGHARILMRQEKVLKICANHFLTQDMTLKAGKGSDRSWVWNTLADISDNETKPAQFAAKFQTKEIAGNFKAKFIELQQKKVLFVPDSPAVSPFAANSLATKPTSGHTKVPVLSSNLPYLSSTPNKPAETMVFTKPNLPSYTENGPSAFSGETPFSNSTGACSKSNGLIHGDNLQQPQSGYYSMPYIQLNKLSDNGKEPQLSQATETMVFTKPNLPSYVDNGQSKRSSGETPFSCMTLASSKRSGALDSETFLDQSNKLLQSSQAFYFGSERAVTRATFHPSDTTSSSYPRNTFSFESETHAPVLRGNKKISCAYDKAFRNRSTSESRNEHIFGDILGRDSLSFRDLASKNETRTAFRSLSTTETDFPGFGKPVFSVPDVDRKEEQDTGNEANIDFKPIVSLPLVKNQGELTKFSERARLFRFDPACKEWKERGVGKIKLLYDPSSGKSRVVMRREQVHKLCANHFILPSMKLKANTTSNRSWLWHTHADVSDGDPKAELLAVKFKQEETASQFKKIFESLQSVCPASNDLIADQDNSTNMSVAPDSQSAAPRSQLNNDLKVQFQPPPGSWSYDTCMVQNSSQSTQCVACQTPKTGLSQPIQQPKFSLAPFSSFSFGSPAPVLPTISQTNNGAKSSFNAGVTFASSSFSFGSQTSKDKTPKCETLKLSDFSIGGGKTLRNEKKFEKSPFVISLQKSNSNLSKTPSQDMKNKNNKLDSIISDSQHKEKSLKDLLTQPSLTLAFQPAKGSWECDRCLVRNALKSNVCVACQSPKPGTQPAVTTSGFNFSAGTSPDFSFGLSHTNKASTVGTGSYFNASNVNKHLSRRSGFRYCSSDTSKDSNKASAFSFGQPLQQTDESKAPGYGTSFTFGSQRGRKDSLKGPSLSCVPSDESKDTNNKAGLRFRKVESTKIAGSEFSPSNVNKPRIVPNIPKLNAYCSKPTMQPAITNYGSSLNSGTSSVLSFRTSHRNNAHSAETGFNFSPTNVSIDPNQKSGVSFGASSSTKAVVNAKNLTLASKPRQDNSSKAATGGDDLKLKFETYEGALDCDVCIVRNDKQNNSCVASQTSKPGTKQTKFLNSDTFAFGQSFPKQGSFAFTPSTATQSNVLLSGGFTFGQPLSEGFTLGSSSKDNQQSGFSFGAPGSSVSTLLPKDTENLNLIFGDSKGKEGTTPVFAFRLDDSSNVFSSGFVASGQSGFKLGDRKTNQSAFRFGGDMPYEFGKPNDDTTGGNLSLENKKPIERCTKENEDVFKDVPKLEDSTNILSEGTFTFRLDIPKQLTMTSPGNKDVGEENPETEGIVFKSIVSLPTQVDIKTGEEGETTLFSSHAKLYRFIQNSWKERGEGEIKVLYDPTRQRGRVIMRRDQVHVLCANHFITNDMELRPQGSSGKSWLWHVQGDFAENKAKEQLFAVKFGDTKTALAFKCAFEECVDHNVVEDEVIVLSEVSVTEEQRARATKFLSPPNFYAYENQNEIAPEEKQGHDKT